MLREALAVKHARENRIDAHPDDIRVTAGGTHALYLAIQCVLGAGDELLVCLPHWMAVPKRVGFAAGAQYRSFPLYLELQSGAWDAATLAQRLRAAVRPNTRAILCEHAEAPDRRGADARAARGHRPGRHRAPGASSWLRRSRPTRRAS